MTIQSLREKMRKILNNYSEQSHSCTSVQKPSFDKQFCEKYGVTITNGRIYLESPVRIDEICTVSNVMESYEYVDKLFGGRKKVTCYRVICDNKFDFSARYGSGADSLNRGQKIRISGNVSASIEDYGYYDGGIHISIGSKPFQIRFSQV